MTPSPETRPIKVLLVDDNPGDARRIFDLLHEASDEFDVKRVERLESALEHVDRAAVDVVLLDLGLPGSRGLEAIERARLSAADKPIIVLSSLDDEDVALAAVRAGAEDYIPKARIEGRSLARIIRHAIERKRVESRLAAIVRAALDAHITMDADGTIVTWNPQAEAIFGWPAEEVIGQHVADVVVPPSQRDAHRQGLRRFLETNEGPVLNRRIELLALRRDGTEFPVELAITPIRLYESWTFSAFVRDITARVRAEQVQTAVYRIADATHTATGLPELLHSIHDIVGTLMPAKSFYIALHDEETDLITFPYFVDEVDPLPPAPRRPGRGITEYVLRTGRPLLVKPESKLEMDYLGSAEAIGAPSVDWLGVPLKQGERTIGVLAVQSYTPGVRYEERDKEILQFVSIQIATAIERKRSEEALTERTRVAELAAEIGAALTHGTTLAEILKGCCEALVRNLDASFARIWTLNEPQQMLELQASAGLYTHLDGPHSRVPVGKFKIGLIVSERLPHVTNTVVGDPRVGDQEWAKREGMVAFAGYPLLVQDRVVGVAAMFARHPFTSFVSDALATVADSIAVAIERKRAEEALRALELQLRQAQKMEAVGRLAGGIAHDFNNLLTAIFGYSDLLAEDLPEGSPAREDLNEIRTAATRAAALTQQLLAFSRQQVLQPIVLNMNDVIGDLENMLQRVLGEDVELETHQARDLGNVKADPGQLEQVIMNLAVNARDAMPTGGKLTIETSNVALSGDYAAAHRPVASGDYIMLAVSDSGIGMDETVKTRLFEPFFTTKGVGAGTGLGLATVYGIVKQSGGYIWVYSEPGHGATFKVYLPRVQDPVEEVKQAPPPAADLGGRETILLAEDEELLRPLARELLVRLGYRVIEATNAAEALDLARAHPDEIHLLVSDVVMPGQSGLQLARQLATERPNMKVLYMSGYTDEAIARHGLLDPGTNFLQKPFTPTVLARKVREVLDAR